MRHITEIADDIIDDIRHPSIELRSAAEGTARGLLRDMVTSYDVRPEEYRRAYRDLVSLCGVQDAETLRQLVFEPGANENWKQANPETV